jgi:hypothetical protein
MPDSSRALRWWVSLASAGKGNRSYSPDTQSIDNKNFASIGLVTCFMNASGDKQPIQVRATKSTGGRFDAGEVDLL